MTFDPHTEPHYDYTVGQLSFFTIWCGCLLTWLFRTIRSSRNDNIDLKKSDQEPLIETKNGGTGEITNGKFKLGSDAIVDVEANGSVKNGGDKAVKDGKKPAIAKNFSNVKPPPTFDEFLLKVVLFGMIMFYFYLCDYRKIFPKLDRVYSRDTFLFLVFLLFLSACAFTIKPTKDIILNRDQTEEWKGWMQVMFVWYHVFAAQEWYNWIRVYIAAYVWMTGFGNFSFFWVRNDYTLWRVLKMQFRLNFLVTCICVVTSNEYMLYYICAMHSYWFFTVYVFMRVLTSWNTDSKKMAIKFIAYFAFNFALFDIPVIRDNVFRPLWPILQYNDPRFTIMHEWTFRAGLDHWACFAGMLCAYNYPHFENFMKAIEKADAAWKRLLPKLVMIFMAVLGLFVWYKLFMGKDKYEYNKIHPYTSVFPLIFFIILRNSFPVLRQYYLSMFAWLGKITLETYLAQLHIYLQSNAKHLIGYIPGYPLLNFSMSSVIYIPMSYMLFNLTTDFSAYLIPKDLKTTLKNALLVAMSFFVPYSIITGYGSLVRHLSLK